MVNTSASVTVDVHKAELFGPGWQSFVFLSPVYNCLGSTAKY